MSKSLDGIVDLGFDCISYDIQHTWLHPSRRTAWDVVVKACGERGLSIVPVVSYGFLPGAGILGELTGSQVTTAVNSEGDETDYIDVYDLANADPIIDYLEMLTNRYGDALLRMGGKTLLNFWEPSMVDWSGTKRHHLGYGPQVIEGFRRWVTESSSLAELNNRWGTSFPSEDRISPPRRGLWDEDRQIIFIQPDAFWDDWCLYRAKILARFYDQLLTHLKRKLRVLVALGLSQHGVVTQHDAFHQRCIYLPFWKEVPVDRFIVSDDLYCKSRSEVKLCMEAELALFNRCFGKRMAAFVTPVEGRILVERPSVLYSLCSEFGLDLVYLYAWNEMGDGANIRDHHEIWPEIQDLVRG